MEVSQVLGAYQLGWVRRPPWDWWQGWDIGRMGEGLSITPPSPHLQLWGAALGAADG